MNFRFFLGFFIALMVFNGCKDDEESFGGRGSPVPNLSSRYWVLNNTDFSLQLKFRLIGSSQDSVMVIQDQDERLIYEQTQTGLFIPPSNTFDRILLVSDDSANNVVHVQDPIDDRLWSQDDNFSVRDYRLTVD